MRDLVRRVAKRLYASDVGRGLIRLALGIGVGRVTILAILARQPSRFRRVAVPHLMSLIKPRTQHRFVGLVGRWADRKPSNALKDIFWLALANSKDVEQAWPLLEEPAGAEQAEKIRRITTQPYAKAIAAYELGRYKEAVRNFLRVQSSAPSELCANYDYLKAAYSAGNLCDKELACDFFVHQYTDPHLLEINPDISKSDEVMNRVYHDVLCTLMPHISRLDKDVSDRRIGVFFLSSTDALGHAILDPYHFLALYRNKFDNIYYVGPRRTAYRPASGCCLDIVESCGRYIETSSDPLLNLSWMSIGNLSIPAVNFEYKAHDLTHNLSWFKPEVRNVGPFELIVENYWSLLRQVVHRSRDPSDSFHHNQWHLTVPRHFARLGEEFCEHHGIDLDRPIVVLHARDPSYHKLGKQDFRDTDIATYRAAVEHLLDTGHQVVRIGDRKMPRLRLRAAGYYELPFLRGYEHALDPFLISRARFMIGCQSGPCAYARAFGVPLLSVNAVLHYTLLPSTMEMACFKRYYRVQKGGGPARELGIAEALAARATHLDNSYQYRRAAIRLAGASAEEVLASVNDMLVWLERPDLPLTADQREFADAAEGLAEALAIEGASLDLPIADFVGISLPGYRISPTVAAMRAPARDVSAPRPDVAAPAARREEERVLG